MNRRSFIKNGVRTVITGGLLSMGGFLVFREKEPGNSCDFDFVCRNCKQLKACNLPEANQFRTNNKTQNP